MLLLRMSCGRLSKKTEALFARGARDRGLLDSRKEGTVIRYLILCARVGKHTDELAQELVSSTEGKTDCSESHTDGWDGYERVLCDRIDHYISKLLTQRLERTNGIIRQQTLAVASPTKHERLAEEGFPRQLSQIWQAVAADRGNCETDERLLPLDLEAFVPGNYSRTESRVN